MNIYKFFLELSLNFEENDIVITGTGSDLFAGSQAIRLLKGMRYITSGGLASMGYSIPASIGAAVGTKERVICIVGDGAFQQNIQELQTIVHYKLPIKIFILNNGGYFSIRTTHKKYFNGCIGESPETGVSFPEVRRIAKAYRIPYLKDKIKKTLDHKGYVICEVMIDQEKLK